MWFDKIWKDPVWSKVISAGILVLFGLIGNKFSNGWVTSALQTFWGWIKAVLFFKIAVIWIICGLAILIFILYLWARLSKKPSFPKEPSTPAFFSYTSDVFNGYAYEWNYCENYPYETYSIDENTLRILCPKCGTAIYHFEYGATCPRCTHFIASYSLKPIGDILLVIQDNIKRNIYDRK